MYTFALKCLENKQSDSCTNAGATCEGILAAISNGKV